MRPQLRDGAVHVWRASLDAPCRERASSLLAPAERARARAIVDMRRRCRWVRSRGLLRLLLAAYLDAEPGALELVRRPSGKLALPAPAPLRFNIAHSGPLAVYAFSRSVEVGVDVEVPRARAPRELALAERAFGAARALQLALLSPSERAVEFRRLWVRREAALKCSGVGVFPSGDRVSAPAEAPWMHELDGGHGALAAVAAEREPAELSCFDVGSAAAGAGIAADARVLVP